MDPRAVASRLQTVETRCGREGHTRPRGPSEKPWWSGPQHQENKTQRDGHNSGVKIWSLCSVSSTLPHANLQPFRTLAIKREVIMLLKKSSCVFLLASLSLCRCDAAWTCKWLYNTRCYLSRPEWTWVRWKWRSTPHSPKFQNYWNLTIKLFSVISRTLVGGVLPFGRDAVGVFFNPSSTGAESEGDKWLFKLSAYS